MKPAAVDQSYKHLLISDYKTLVVVMSAFHSSYMSQLRSFEQQNDKFYRYWVCITQYYAIL